jgi:hypothetical protein
MPFEKRSRLDTNTGYKVQQNKAVIGLRMSFEVSNVELLLNDFIRPRQHVRRNRQTDLFGGF